VLLLGKVQPDPCFADIRLTLAQGQPLGENRFAEAMCKAAGVRRNNGQRGRPITGKDEAAIPLMQSGFGF